MKPIIHLITLGCSKNTVDSETLMKQLEADGFPILFDSGDVKADIVIINTCGFIHDARQESVDTILHYAEQKINKKIKKLIVMGCLSQRYRKEMEEELTEVDRYFGTKDMPELLKYIKGVYRKEILHQRVLSTPGHYAYLKIAEGCNRLCAFCSIPLMRGDYISRTPDHILKEARYLAELGVKELIVIAQDTTYYGRDKSAKNSLSRLLEQLSEVKGIDWIRLQYTYPAGFPTDILQVMKKRTNICRYIDIPFQHISNSVLSLMRRGNTSRQAYNLVERIRKEIPGIALRTTLMVGHPGETKNDFRELVDFVENVQFDRLGVFAYSHEEGTFAGNHYHDNIPKKVKEERLSEIMVRQQKISLRLNQKKTGTQQKVIIDGQEKKHYIGRTEHDSPEVDNIVILPVSGKKIKTGCFYTAKITGAGEYELWGEII